METTKNPPAPSWGFCGVRRTNWISRNMQQCEIAKRKKTFINKTTPFSTIHDINTYYTLSWRVQWIIWKGHEVRCCGCRELTAKDFVFSTYIRSFSGDKNLKSDPLLYSLLWQSLVVVPIYSITVRSEYRIVVRAGGCEQVLTKNCFHRARTIPADRRRIPLRPPRYTQWIV